MKEGTQGKDFDFQEILKTTPELKAFVDDIRTSLERNNQQPSGDQIEELFSIMDGVFQREAWLSWLNHPNSRLNGNRPSDLIVRGRIDKVKNLVVAIGEGIFV